MSYLIHFNQNHSPKNGQFISGDGDGDGIINDHANQDKNEKRKVGKAVALGIIGTAAFGIGVAGLVNEFRSAKTVGSDSTTERGRRYIEDLRRMKVAKFVGGDW